MISVHSENTQSVREDLRISGETRAQSCGWEWRSFGTLVGLLGGIVSVLVGSVLTVITWITGTEGPGVYVHALAGDFLVLTIPLLLLGGVCLDLEEKRKKTQKESESNERK